jgi:ABC-type molybdenum transport system ATPase subunit/photorepair protein PhrA
MSLLTAHDVEVERGDRRLLTGVSLTVEAGDIWQLVGAEWRR